MRRLLFSLILVLCTATPVFAARQFNGTTQGLVSASAINLSGSQKAAFAAWVYVDSYTSSSSRALWVQYNSSGGTSPRFRSFPDVNGSSTWYSEIIGDAVSTGDITRPSAANWHHVIINVDLSASSSEIASIIVDGSKVSVTRNADGNNTTNLPADAISFMYDSVGNTLFLAGRIAEIAIWKDINLSCTASAPPAACDGGSDASNLYNGGTGAAATTVQNGNLNNYWKVCGTASPEPATVGGISLTLTGSPTQVTHPIGTCSAAAPMRRRVIIWQ